MHKTNLYLTNTQHPRLTDEVLRGHYEAKAEYGKFQKKDKSGKTTCLRQEGQQRTK